MLWYIQGLVICCVVIPPFLLRGLNRHVKSASDAKIEQRFTITDLLALLFLIQLPFAIANILNVDFHTTPRVVWLAMGLVGVLLWVFSIRACNRIGVIQPVKRMVIVGLIVPGAFASGITAWLIGSAWFGFFVGSHSARPSIMWSICWLVSVVVIDLSIRWVLRGA